MSERASSPSRRSYAGSARVGTERRVDAEASADRLVLVAHGVEARAQM